MTNVIHIWKPKSKMHLGYFILKFSCNIIHNNQCVNDTSKVVFEFWLLSK